jgi:4-amino-4-deoxy-L-arabinose transferase-like glycosyltransferase
VSRVLAALWLLGAVVTWNAVFDAHIVKGARDYVDGQQLFIDGRGPRLDMDRAMAEARSSGLRHAWGWSGAELAAGAVLWFVVRARRKAGPRAGDPARSGHA